MLCCKPLRLSAAIICMGFSFPFSSRLSMSSPHPLQLRGLRPASVSSCSSALADLSYNTDIQFSAGAFFFERELPSSLFVSAVLHPEFHHSFCPVLPRPLRRPPFPDFSTALALSLPFLRLLLSFSAVPLACPCLFARHSVDAPYLPAA